MKKSIITSLCLLMLTAGLSWSQYGSRSNPAGNYTINSQGGSTETYSGESTVVFSDNFDVSDTVALKTRGWLLYQYSVPVGTTFWFQGNETVIPHYEGIGYVGANYNNTSGTGVINSWMVSPLIDIAVGDTITYWERAAAAGYDDSLYFKMSPTGDPAASAFSMALGGGLVSGSWTERRFVSAITGSVRIAFQYHVTNAGPSGANSDYIGIDDLKILRGGTPPGAFNLLEPADDTRLVVHSTSVATIDAIWSTSVDPGTVTYTFVADSSASFGATKIQFPSNNTGADTVFTIPYQGLDEYLEDLGVARGDSLVIYWKAIASNGTLTTTSTETWSMNVVRDNYVPSDFDLIAPINGGRIVVNAMSGTSWIDPLWESSIDPEGEPINYTFMMDSSANFGPTTMTEFSGADTTVSIDLSDIDAYAATLGVLPGDSIILKWAVIATDGFHNVMSTSIYDLKIVRELLVNNPPTPAHLLFPANGSRIVVYPNSPDSMNITWTKSVDPDADPVAYTFMIDVVPTFDSGDEFTTPSNNSGADTVWTAYLDGLEDYVEDLGVAFGDSIILYWKVVSSDLDFDINSAETFSMKVVRTLPPPTIVFFDDFESGTTKWTLQGTWGLATATSHSPTHSLAESPTGNYAANLNISATMATGLNLSSALDATISFWAQYQIESGFDYMYLEASTNGTTWNNVATFSSDALVPWQKYTYSLGGYVGNSNVKVRFRFTSDGGLEMAGMNIDDVEIGASNYDASAPLITHTGTEFYQGTINAKQVVASIVDISGIQSAELQYTVDNGMPNVVLPDSNNGSTYYFTIPGLAAGSWVKYWIEATDNSPDNNFGESDEYEYISGNYLSFDDPTVDFVTNFQTGTGAAVRINTPTNFKGRLVTALIRNYTDNNRPNDSMIVHIWSDAAGLPGTDLITPFKIKPEATLINTSPMTRIDLRPYAAQLNDLTAFHVGFTVPDGAVDTVWITIRQPGSNGRASVFNGATWAAPGTATDYHFRAIMDTLKSTIGIGEDIAGNPNKYELYQNYPNPFNPTTTIKYDLKENAKVTLKIFNTLGQEVRTLVNSTENAGPHHIIWDGKDNAGNQVSSGLYIYRLQAGSFVKSHKMMFLK